MTTKVLAGPEKPLSAATQELRRKVKRITNRIFFVTFLQQLGSTPRLATPNTSASQDLAKATGDPMLSFLIHSLVLAIAALTTVRAAAPHNVTVLNGNSQVRYYPATGSDLWKKWPNPGCLDTTGGMWTAGSGPIQPTVSLTFTGTDIYVYGQFDDETSLPIYTVTVDGIVSDKMGSQGILHVDRCKPIYSKSGLSQAQHTVVFTLTTDRPGDIRDLAFDGFIYTTTDATVTSSTTPTSGTSGGYDGTNLLDPFHFGLSTPAIAGIIAGAILLILAAALGLIVRRRRAAALSQAQYAHQETYQPPIRPQSMDEAPPPRPTTFYTPPPQQTYPQFNQNVGYNMPAYQYNNAPQPVYAPPPMVLPTQPPWSPPPTMMSYEPAPSPWNPNVYNDSHSHLLPTTPSSPYTGSQGHPGYFDPSLSAGGYDHQQRQPSPAESYPPASTASPQPTVDYQVQSHQPGPPAPLTGPEVDMIVRRVTTAMREGSGGDNATKSSYAPVTSRGEGSGSGTSARPALPAVPQHQQGDPAMFPPRNDERPSRENNQGQPPRPDSDAPPPFYQG